MAALAKCNLNKGDKLDQKDFHFCRTSQLTGVSQLDFLNVIGSELVENIKTNQVIDWNHIGKK